MIKLFLWWSSGGRLVLKWYLPQIIRPIKRLIDYPLDVNRDVKMNPIEEMYRSMEACTNEANGWDSFIEKQLGDPFAGYDAEKVIRIPKSPVEWIREVLYILRPVATASAMLLADFPANTSESATRGRQWSFWGLALGLEMFALYPELKKVIFERSPIGIDRHYSPEQDLAWEMSMPESEERYLRVFGLLYHLLREPFYSLGMQKSIDWMLDGISAWRLLKPLAGNI
jgi:hypothetical protein